MTSTAPPPPGGARYHSWLFAPDATRDGLAALLTVEREIEDSCRPGLEHSVAHARLDWWQQEAAQLAAGRPRHPATRALAAALAASDPPDLAPLVETARWQHAQLAFGDRDELRQALQAWGATVFATACQLGVPDGARTPATQAALHAFALRAGEAVREIEWLSEAMPRARRGLLSLPLDELAATGCDHGALHASPMPGVIAALLRARLERGATELREAAASLPAALRASARVGLLWSATAATLACDSAAALPNQYAASRFAPLGATLAAWRAARACLRGQLPVPLRQRSTAA
ncbi:MAG: squalene/phytoene synthase family protein [Steroidobacteraceae bacterium]